MPITADVKGYSSQNIPNMRLGSKPIASQHQRNDLKHVINLLNIARDTSDRDKYKVALSGAYDALRVYLKR